METTHDEMTEEMPREDEMKRADGSDSNDAGEGDHELSNEVSRAPRCVELRMADRALYRGQVNEASELQGIGVLYSRFGSDRYTGEFQDGHPSGLGVTLASNGGYYAGETHNGFPHGFGVKLNQFGERSIGHWCDGELQGPGMTVDAEGTMAIGHFEMSELSEEQQPEWKSIENHVQRALWSEQQAVTRQERAREVEISVKLQETTAVDVAWFQQGEEIAAFEAEEEQQLQPFLMEQQVRLRAVESDSDRWKFQEAQLKARQKVLRSEINEKRSELSYVAKYCRLADERKAQLSEAERTLDMLQRQLVLLQNQVENELNPLLPPPDDKMSQGSARGSTHSRHSKAQRPEEPMTERRDE
ncbi:hypothetical protein Poli38472_012295 [Pythium oligandrum]|uniref:Uncharacterized protein n=1 Tax=Pythium oligandrum TaxID=41045 RepID=A0A8K1CPE8_PYTOL|nr:hypothetical protein Poli38472_012295 [Pythium oligandrum]|eukprot:TMW67179.1 hypothetical protein Poli38472_012295 [Pythium oligandrum]